MSAGRILVVDDQPQMRRFMRTTLTTAGYEIDDAKTGEEALVKLREFHPDLVLLDINMPGMGGLAACREIRSGTSTGIIMLTVRNTEADKVAALDAGADDYVVKPFGSEELMARIRAALRRTSSIETLPVFETADLTIDFSKRLVTVHGEHVRLTPKEFDLLRHLVSNQGKAIPHRRLLQAVWGPDYGDQVDYLRAIIRNLRKKLEINPDDPQYIKTEPWVGYRFNGTPEPE